MIVVVISSPWLSFRNVLDIEDFDGLRASADWGSSVEGYCSMALLSATLSYSDLCIIKYSLFALSVSAGSSCSLKASASAASISSETVSRSVLENSIHSNMQGKDLVNGEVSNTTDLVDSISVCVCF